MKHTVLGKTGLSVGCTGFGCIPIQRISQDESTVLLRRAYDAGVTLFDTANAYTVSEERIGIALGEVRQNIVLATKTAALEPDKMMANIDNSLAKLRTDYIDILQVHNPDFVPHPDEENGVYDALLLAKKQGKIRHIGITFHKLGLAVEAVKSGLYDTMQYPLSYLSSDEELALTSLCKEHNVGLLIMKGMAGGLLTNARGAFAFLRQYENGVPIWGMQHMDELEEFLRYEADPPSLDGDVLASVEADRDELGSSFCRGCGYCLPCPAEIPINFAARITYFMRRFPKEPYLTDEWKEKMDRIGNCTNCGHCKRHCPYSLNPHEMLNIQRQGYNEIYNEFHGC